MERKSIIPGEIVVEGEDDATTITTKSGTLQMIATLMPANADDSTVTWKVNNPAIGTINSAGLLTAVADGDVIVTATANDGSGIFGTKTITISNQSTGSVNNTYKSSINIYPNPAEDKLTIVTHYNISQVNILTISGQLIQAQKMANNTVDISNLESGIYFVEVQINDSWSRHKIIKK